MQQSKCCVLPLDDTPIFKCIEIKTAANVSRGELFLRPLLQPPKLLGWKMGLEPTVSGATNRRFNQLSYIHRRTSVIIYQSIKFVNHYFKPSEGNLRKIYGKFGVNSQIPKRFSDFAAVFLRNFGLFSGFCGFYPLFFLTNRRFFDRIVKPHIVGLLKLRRNFPARAYL